MKKSHVKLGFCFSLLIAGFMFTAPAFAAYKVGDCLGGDELMKDGLWKPSKKCGGKVATQARNDVKRPLPGASSPSAPAR